MLLSCMHGVLLFATGWITLLSLSGSLRVAALAVAVAVADCCIFMHWVGGTTLRSWLVAKLQHVAIYQGKE